MGSFSIWHWLIVLVVVLVLFGRGRVNDVMGEFGKGIKSFKEGMGDDDRSSKPTQRIEGPQHDAKPAGETIPDPAAKSDVRD